MSPKAIKPGEGQFDLFSQQETAERLSIPKSKPVSAPESNPIADRIIEHTIGSAAVQSTLDVEPKIDTLDSPIKVDVSTRRDAMIDVLDALDVVESTEHLAVAQNEKNDPKKPFAYGYDKLLRRKGMTAQKIEEGHTANQAAHKKADEAFDVMWGREVIEEHGKSLGANAKDGKRAVDEAVQVGHYIDQHWLGRIVHDGTDKVILQTDAGQEATDIGRVEGEGFFTKYTSGDRLNPASSMMTEVSKQDARKKRSAFRKELKAQIKTGEKVSRNKSSEAKAAGIRKMLGKATKAVVDITTPQLDIGQTFKVNRPGVTKPDLNASTPYLSGHRRPTSMSKQKPGNGWGPSTNIRRIRPDS